MEIEGSGFAFRESKFDYFFGRVTSSAKKQRRSLQNLENLRQLGIDEAADGRERLLEIFTEGLTAQETERNESEYRISIIRKVEVSRGEVVGAIEITYFYPNGNLTRIPEISTIIPKIYK